MRLLTCCLTLLLPLALLSAPAFAADTKWVHATSEHFDLYTAESEGDAKAALLHLEAVRFYFLTATHSKDPGGQSVRIVAFHSAGDYVKYRPQEVGSAKAYAQVGATPATIVALGLKPEIYEQIFREYTQLVMDESSPSLPYWLRAGIAGLYATLKPAEKQIKLGTPPFRDYRSAPLGDLDLNTMFSIDRAGLLAARNRQGTDFHSDNAAKANVFGAANAAQSTALSQTQSAMAQDYDGGIWMLTHMIMFQPEYRPKFSEFVSVVGSGVPTGTAFVKVYGRSLPQVSADLLLHSRLPSLSAANLPFKYEAPPAPQPHPATKDEQDRIFADLAAKAK